MKKLLIVGSADRAYREYILETLARHYALHLLTDKPPQWELGHVASHRVTELADTDRLLECAASWHTQEAFAGVMTFHEMQVESTARVAAALGLRGLSLAASRCCRDKLLMREALAAADVPSAMSRPADSLEQALAIAAQIGYPVVVKPRSLAASIGVVRVDSAEAMEDAYSVAASAAYPGAPQHRTVLVEEYLDGEEVSVESVVVDGNVQTVAITEKSVGFAPYFEEIGHVVNAAARHPLDDRIRAVVKLAVHALGITMGITHVELRLTSRRGPCVVEVGARLGGDLIPCLVGLATGVDLPRAAGAIACGDALDLASTIARAATVRFLYPPFDGRLRSACVPPHDEGEDGLYLAAVTANAGSLLQLPPRAFGARLGHVVVTGNHRNDAVERAERWASRVVVDMEPAMPRRRARLTESAAQR